MLTVLTSGEIDAPVNEYCTLHPEFGINITPAKKRTKKDRL